MYNIYTILYSLKKHYSLNIWQFIAQHVYKLSSSNHTWNRWVLCHISTLNRKCNDYLSYFICSSRLAWVEVLWGSTLTPLILKWWNENKKNERAALRNDADGQSWLTVTWSDETAPSAERSSPFTVAVVKTQTNKTKTLNWRNASGWNI